jgi:hypothetical protein
MSETYIRHDGSESKRCDRCNRGIKVGSLYVRAHDADYGPECVVRVRAVEHLFSDSESIRVLVKTQFRALTGAQTRAGMARKKAAQM